MATAFDISGTANVMHALARAAAQGAAPRIYYLSPLRAGALAEWDEHLARAARLGFSHVLIAPPFHGNDLFLAEDFDRPHPVLQAEGDADAALRAITAACTAHGLTPLLDVMVERVAAGGAIAAANPDLFRPPDPARALDPRCYAPEGDIAAARFDDAAEALADWWGERLRQWQDTGFAGFRLVSLRAIPPVALRRLAANARRDGRACLLLGWTPELSAAQQDALAGCGLDYVFASLPWWDFRAEWLWTEAERLRRVARLLAPVEAPFGKRLVARIPDPALRETACRRAARFAAGFGDGWLMPMGFEAAEVHRLDTRRDSPAPVTALPSLAAAVIAANAQTPPPAPPRLLTAPGADVIALLRPVPSGEAVLLAVNAELDRPVRAALAPLVGPWQGAEALDRLGAGEVATLTLHTPPPITLARPALPRSAEEAARAPRLAIERVTPSVDGGRFAAKRIVGESVQVSADVVADGHDQLAVALLWRSADEAAWHQARMRPLGNDRWTGAFALTRVGRWLFTIEAWRDAFGTFRDELSKKHAAGVDVRLELIEGREMVEEAAQHVPALRGIADALAASDPPAQVALLLAARTAALMAEADQRPFAVRLSPPCPVDADRPIAAFASWYELFPRSMSDDPHRHGTFADVIRHLPRIRDMGFDVLYFPPIHPIGHTNRKGRNNALRAGPDDPGSPYAIGSEAGGHDAVHPELGTLDDFARLRDAATAEGIELALDFAIQCSPDHPWLRQHREWFDWRPDGSIKYAENPPKRYEDIVNVDFYAPGAVPDLWVALCEVVLFWAGQGVRIFRVDNPHTKPFPFWEWLIGEVRASYPDAIFLSEAFTRPKVMKRLAKLGFTQSYTYFTWRNTKQELQDYLTELTGETADFMRPNFFVNTPDINPLFLQASGRPGFLIRAALAATLSPLWGMYCGFELCEATPLPGREEYLDSEKYQLRAWDWHRPGNIVAEIAQLNRIRRHNPALHSVTGLTFLICANDHVLAYEKATPDRANVLLIAVSLDPHHPQMADIELPLWKWGLPDSGTLRAEDLLAGTADTWHGKWRRITLAPDAPYGIWRLHTVA
jgi:starch synthase (maltosyl-transferring)